ncbi:MAG: hypothetical protein NVSMB20_03100 [Bradyrhizobium sp.]
MKAFDLAGFAAHLGKLGVSVIAEQHHALEHAAMVVEKEAKSSIGTRQGAAGPFVAWAPLAQTTLDGWGGHPGKIALGYSPPENPLLREGDLRNSIEHTVHLTVAYVGSNSDIAVWQELGTEKMPPRSFLGGAAFRKAHQISHDIGHSMAQVLMGRGVQTRIT